MTHEQVETEIDEWADRCSIVDELWKPIPSRGWNSDPVGNMDLDAYGSWGHVVRLLEDLAD